MACRCSVNTLHPQGKSVSKSKLEIVQARQSRGEELRLGFILAAIRPAEPRKAAGGRKSARRVPPRLVPEPA
jgi:hypothetical protein